MRTKRKLLPKSIVSGSAGGNAASGNVSDAARQVRVPEFSSNICGLEQRSTEGVGNDCAAFENLEDGRTRPFGSISEYE
ncbi:hypothetical protein Tco_1446314, partial [Tanacetum coccineum]